MYRHIDYFQTMYKHNQLYIYICTCGRASGRRAPSLQILQPPRGGERPLLQDVAARRQLGRASEIWWKKRKWKKVKESVKVKGNRKWKKAMMEAEQMEGETTEATVATATSDESGSEKVLDLPCWDITNYTPGIAGTHSMQAKTCCISIVELGERRTASDAVP